MLTVQCSGSPYDIGQQHGTQAAAQVRGTMAFYEAFFKDMAKRDWEAVCHEASKWLPFLENDFPQYVAEMQGIADAVGVPLDSIIAINVRTEVAFGMYSDGCTSLSFHSSDTGILAQNWDWRPGQSANLVNLEIRGADAPAISIITEAGIIGKIGLCSSGVGVCLNAIAALGVDYNRLPVHIALRAALDWAGDGGPGTARKIVERLKSFGVASAAHIFVADAHEAIGLEVSYLDEIEVPKVAARGGESVLHSNHYVVEHPGVKLGRNILPDSQDRLVRIEELLQTGKGDVTTGEIKEWLCDTKGYPGSICRDRAASGSETIFRIIMDLKNVKAEVKVGKPDGDGEVFTLEPRLD